MHCSSRQKPRTTYERVCNVPRNNALPPFARLEQESVSHQRQPDGHQEQLNGHQEQLDRHQLLIDECAIRLKRTWQAVSNTSEAKNDVPVRYAMMPYHSIEAEGITYFFQKDDEEIPGCMDRTGMNYSKYDIDHFYFWRISTPIEETHPKPDCFWL
mgnify:CR=1 FL=1